MDETRAESCGLALQDLLGGEFKSLPKKTTVAIRDDDGVERTTAKTRIETAEKVQPVGLSFCNIL